MISCRTCGHAKETAHMQLETRDGYRGICCSGCHRQARVTNNLCQCRVIWHQCPVHQGDPAVHRSAKPATSSNIGKPKLRKAQLSLYRNAPEALSVTVVKRRRVEGHSSGSHLHSHSSGISCNTAVVPRLNLDLQPKLAAKFPHLATTTGIE